MQNYFGSKIYKSNKMQNPHSATQRFKNHLAYQLGLCMIYFDKGGENNSQNSSYNTKNIMGQNKRNLKNPFHALQFCYTLVKIIQQYKKQKRIYQQTIAVFPNLKFPSLESCKDYHESLQVKYHLASLLGESLMKANNTLFKGGYFKLPKEIKKANEKYKEISYIIKILKEVDLKTYQEIRNKGEITKLAKIHQKFYSLLQYHKDHKSLLQKIFCVFNYDSNFFMCHFEKILLWLTSPKFQTYIDTNHPYPPLLNPLWFKENIESSHFRDSTPILSYQDIPAEVAWEINLPLPRRYNAIVAFFGLSGHLALISFMIRCGASIHCLSNGKSLKIDYQIAYKTLLENKINFLIHVNYMQSKNSRKHILSLVDARVPTLILLRDPLGRLKHGINHGWYKNNLTHYTLNQIKESLDRVTYEGQNKPHLDLLESAHENKNIGSLGIWEYYQTIKELRNITSVQYIDMQEIVGKKPLKQ